MRCTIVYNPVSRRGKRVYRHLREHVEARPVEIDARWVTRPDAGTEPYGERVIVAGGDGTVNVAASWLVRHDAKVTMAIVPGGTGNNLARGLGLPVETDVAIPLAFGGQTTRPVDGFALEATGRDGVHEGVCVQSCTVGYPAETSRRFDDLRHTWWFKPIAKGLGDPAYTLVALAWLPQLRWQARRGHPGLAATFELPDEKLDLHVFAIFVGNEPTVGGGFVPTPQAEVDDGILDLCWVRANPPDRYLKIFQRIRKGTHVELGGSVDYRRTTGPLAIRLGTPSTVMVDGELVRGIEALTLTVLPGRFPIVVP